MYLNVFALIHIVEKCSVPAVLIQVVRLYSFQVAETVQACQSGQN